MIPSSLGDVSLLSPLQVPEAGTWYHTDRKVDGDPVFARVPLEGDGHEDENALMLAWERTRNLEVEGVPKAVAFDATGPVLLMAAPEGVPLRRLLEHRTELGFTVTPATVLDFGLAVAEVLVHAHEKGRPHGHLSPDSLWISRTGRVVVWGFGEGPDAPGPARWWAPERARGKRASGDADQWALGALLASLVTARLPWRSDDPITEARVGDASHLCEPVLEQWKPLGRLLERMLASEPRDRFPSIHPVRQSLMALRQRVAGESELARLGTLLGDLYAPPSPAAPAPVWVPEAGWPVEEDHEPATRISEEEPPLDANDPQPLHAPPLELSPTDFEVPTDFGTSPTRVPDGMAETAVDLPMPVAAVALGRATRRADEVEDATSPFESSPVTIDPEDFEAPEVDWMEAIEPANVPDLPSGSMQFTMPDEPMGGPGSEPGVLIEEAVNLRPEPEETLAIYERYDARPYAPWLLVALGVVLVIFAMWSVS